MRIDLDTSVRPARTSRGTRNGRSIPQGLIGQTGKSGVDGMIGPEGKQGKDGKLNFTLSDISGWTFQSFSTCVPKLNHATRGDDIPCR